MSFSYDEIEHAYLVKKLSCKQIADVFCISPMRVVRTLAARGVQLRTRSEAIRNLHVTKFNKKGFSPRTHLDHSDELLKVAGVMLYWGEGTKRGGSVALANSDPAIIKVFLQFLRRVCGVDESRLRISVHYYEDHDVQHLNEFWSHVTGIPLKQFNKPILHKRRDTGTYRKPSVYGTVLVRYSDTRLLELLLGWIQTYGRAFSG